MTHKSIISYGVIIWTGRVILYLEQRKAGCLSVSDWKAGIPQSC